MRAADVMEVDHGDGATTAQAPASSRSEEYALLKRAVRESPTDYAAHLSFVQYLRKDRPSSLDLLKAREEFSARFPLSPELWSEWIEDRKAGGGGPDASAEVIALYRRAFADYQCADLWQGYLETLEDSLDEDDDGGMATMREAFEEALSCMGTHPLLGGAVWREYRRFEAEELEDAKETGAEDAEISKALDRVKRLLRRQLSVPLVGNDEVFADVRKLFAGDEGSMKDITAAHAKAIEMLAARMEHEQAVARCQENEPGGNSVANAWEAYAAMEAADGHPSRAVLVLERAESEGCCLHERIWVMHSDVLLAEMSAYGPEEKATERAVRNITWSSELWCRRLRSLERSADRSGAGGDDPSKAAGVTAVRRAWRDALASALVSPDDYVKVLLAYCSFFRRRLVAVVETAAAARASGKAGMIGPAPPPSASGAHADDSESPAGGEGHGELVMTALEGIRQAFEEAEAFVEKNYPGWNEGWLMVVRQRIEVEDEVVADLAELLLPGVEAESQARRQWARVLRHYGKHLAAWLEAVAWERRTTGDLLACRRLFSRSIKEIEDYPEAACSAFLKFEQETGSLEEWDAANKEVFRSRASRGLLSRDLPLASRAWTGGAATRPVHQPTQRQRSAKRDAANPAVNPSGDRRRERDRAGKKAGSKRAAGDDYKGGSGGGGSNSSSSKRQRTAMETPTSVERREQNMEAAAPVKVAGGVRSSASHPADRGGTDGNDGAGLSAGGTTSGGRGGGGADNSEEETKGKSDEKRGKKKRKKKGATEAQEEGGGANGASGVKWPAHPTTVFVRGLGAGTTSENLREAFSGVGAVVEARVVEDKKTRQVKDYGLVQFEEAPAVDKALDLDGSVVCGGKVKITRSRHPAVMRRPTPVGEPSAAAAASNTAGGDKGESKGGLSSGKRANDWECVNPDCDNMCFSFRTRCNRCGVGRDGSPPPAKASGSGGSQAERAALAADKAVTSHRPRLQLGFNVRPRALRNDRVANGSSEPNGSARSDEKGRAKASESKRDAKAAGDKEPMPAPPALPRKSNADFRAMLNRG